MIPSHFAALELSGASLGRLRAEYLDWILGHGNYREKRDARLDIGIHRGWTHRDLIDAGTSAGLYDCSVAVRQGIDSFLLRFTHRDAREPSVLWHTLARGQTSDDSVLLEHGVARSSPRGVLLADVAAPPQVLRRLSKWEDVRLRRPKGLFHRAVLRINSDEVDGFVRHVLTDDARALPYVIVSVDEGGDPLVDPSELATALFTLAAVVLLQDDDAAREFGRSMRSLRFEEKFGRCFNGAVRLYEAPLLRDGDPFQHYLWLGDRIREIRAPNRTLVIAGEIASRCAHRMTPLGFFRAIERFDREQALSRADSVLRTTAEPLDAALRMTTVRHEPMSDAAAALASRDAELQEVRASLQAAVDEQRLWEEEAARLENTAANLRQQLARAEQERDAEIATVRALRLGLTAAKRGLADPTRDAFLAVIEEDATLEQSLIVLEQLYRDRLHVLESAWESARGSECFRKRPKAFELLHRLVTAYWEDVREGGDARARLVFGREQYAATESETVLNNDAAVRLRTFVYKAERVFMGRHIKIGTKDSLADTLRIHFHYDPDDEKIVIGHCGGHLDFK